MGPRKPHLPAPSPASKSRHVEENRPRNGSASPPALSWYASLSAMSLSPTEAIGSDYLSSSSSFTKQVSNTLSTKPVQGTHPPNQPFQPIVPSQPIPRTLPGQSIPISLLLNPTPQSPRPFAFLELSSRSPSPSPSALSSSAASRLVRSEQRFRCISHAALVADSSTGTLPATEHTPKGGSKRSRLSASEHQSQGVSDSNIPFRLSPDCRSNGTVIYSPTMGKKITSNGKDDASRSLDLLGHGRREFNANETHTGDTTREVSVRKKTKPDVKTTKTGKILHRSRRIGVNKRNTAYNRFLQQRSRYLAKYESHLTPQQRMKQIVQEWAVSEKNTHTTRRKPRLTMAADGEGITNDGLRINADAQAPPLSSPIDGTTNGCPAIRPTSTSPPNCLHQEPFALPLEIGKPYSKSAHPEAISSTLTTALCRDRRAENEIEE